MSHEIRTPMNGVIGMLQLPEREPLEGRPRRWSQTALASARSLLGLVDGLLTVSRLDAGDFRLNPTPTDPVKIVDDVTRLFEHEAQTRNVRIEWRPHPTPLLMIDGSALRQIATNLVGNAVKFTDAGEVRVSLECRMSEDAAMLRLTVEDDGPGVPPEAAERIFEAFEQIDDASARRSGGVGLGLSIVRGLARAMGGDVRLDTGRRRGSRFTVAFPALLAAPAEMAA